jgi:predicted Zn-dependent peptidase
LSTEAGLIQKTVLENGIRVITERMPSAHSASIGFWVENGSRHEGSDLNGISHFLEHMLFKGTERRSALAIAKEIDSVGGVLNGFTSREYSCYYAKVLAQKLPLAIDLLADILLNSVFDAEEIEKERKVILQELYMLEDAPDENIHDLFSQSFWRNDSLGLPILGSRATVGAITREGLLETLRDRYRGESILICAAGNVEHQEIVQQIGELFRNVELGERPVTLSLPVGQRSLGLLEKDLEQVHFCLGTRALPQDHPNRFACYLLNAIFGGSMSSRLFQKVREEAGLAYSIYSYLNSHSDAGALVVYGSTSPEDTPQAIDITLKEFKRLHTELVSEDQLRAAKEQVKGNLLLSLESSDNRMSRLAKNEIYLGRQISAKEVVYGVNQVTSEGIRKLAEFLLQDEYLNLQMIGNIREKDISLVDLTFY